MGPRVVGQTQACQIWQLVVILLLAGFPGASKQEPPAWLAWTQGQEMLNECVRSCGEGVRPVVSLYPGICAWAVPGGRFLRTVCLSSRLGWGLGGDGLLLSGAQRHGHCLVQTGRDGVEREMATAQPLLWASVPDSLQLHSARGKVGVVGGGRTLAGHERDLALGAHCQPEHPTGAPPPASSTRGLSPPHTHPSPYPHLQGREDLNSLPSSPPRGFLGLTPGRAGCGDDLCLLGYPAVPAQLAPILGC